MSSAQKIIPELSNFPPTSVVPAPKSDTDADEIQIVEHIPKPSQKSSVHLRCPAYRLPIPENDSPYLVYPFGLHGTQHLPWSCIVNDDTILLRSHTCSGRAPIAGVACDHCKKLALSPVVQGIVDRMHNGTHQNTNLAYLAHNAFVASLNSKNRQLQSLRFLNLNQTRALGRKLSSLEDSKRLIVAIAEENVPRVARVVHVALTQKRGLAGILEKVMEAARGVYKVKSFQEQDRDLGRLLWRLGGDRLGHIVQRALGMPSVSALRKGTVKTYVQPSAGRPNSEVVAKNTLASLSGIMDILNPSSIKHAVLMFDEIACEKRIRWNPHTNEFLGVCREHGHRVALEFGSVEDAKEMLVALNSGEIHYGSEVSIPHDRI